MLRTLANVSMALLALVALVLYFLPITQEATLDPRRMEHYQGRAYQIALGAAPWPLVVKADSLNRSRHSGLLLWEDGKPLGPAHGMHKKITEQGRGSYSHWGPNLIFSAADGSDPRTNGRKYTVAYPLQPSAVVLWVLSLNLIRLALGWYRGYATRVLEWARDLASGVPFAWKYIGLIVLVSAIIGARVWEILLLPVLQAEDGYYFARFYNSGQAEMIFLRNAGYLRLTSNLLYFAAINLPPRWAPYLLTWLPALLAVFTYSLFLARRFRALIPSDWLRLGICLAFVLSPLGNHLLLTNTDYSSWNMFFLLVLLTMGGMPAKRPWLTFAGLNMAVWGSPLALVVLPLTILNYFRAKAPGAKAFHFLTALNLVLHHCLGTDPSYLIFDLQRIIKWVLLTGHFVVTKVLLPPLLGLSGAGLAGDKLPLLTALIGVGLTVLFVRLVLPKYRAWAWQALYLSLALTLAVMIGRETTYDFSENLNPALRYFHVQTFFSLATLILVFHEAAGALVSRAGGRFSEEPTQGVDLRPLKALLWALVFVYFGLLNTIPKNVSGYRPADPGNGALVSRFFQDLDLAQKAAGSRQGIFLRLDKPNDWPIVIDTRKRD